MLVLSRKQGEAVELAELDVVVRVVSLKKSKVQLGIEAPRQITVCRSEIAGEKKRFSQAVDSSRADQELDVGILDELSTIEAQLAALAELADAKDGPLARDLAADSIQRIASIKRSLRLAMRRQSEERPISDFIKVRADVIDQLRVTSTDSESLDNPDREESDREEPGRNPSVAWSSAKTNRTSCVQERQPGYAVNSVSAVREFGVA